MHCFANKLIHCLLEEIEKESTLILYSVQMKEMNSQLTDNSSTRTQLGREIQTKITQKHTDYRLQQAAFSLMLNNNNFSNSQIMHRLYNLK